MMFATVSARTHLAQQIRLALVAALLALSLVVGMTATAQRVDAKPRGERTYCVVIDDEETWYQLTGKRPDPDFVGGMFCYKGAA